MVKILTSGQMRSLERLAIESGAVSGLELMERAGAEVVEAIFETWPELAREPAATTAPRRAVILCGPGNNGGDGFVVARLLSGYGWGVDILATTLPDRLPPDAAANARAAQQARVPILDYTADTLRRVLNRQEGCILLIDALLGIGQSRPADRILAPAHQAMDWFHDMSPGCEMRTLSVDLPTGIDTDTGTRCARRPFPADLIVTFHSEKPAHPVLRSQGLRVIVKPIGLQESP